MSQEAQIGMLFPLQGVELSCEFGRQPPLTTPVGNNVRAFDQLAEKERGGSRPGLSKFLNGTVNGISVVQHLTVLIDPTTPALAADVGSYPDPSTNNLKTRNTGRLLREGGSGNRPMWGAVIPDDEEPDDLPGTGVYTVTFANIFVPPEQQYVSGDVLFVSIPAQPTYRFYASAGVPPEVPGDFDMIVTVGDGVMQQIIDLGLSGVPAEISLTETGAGSYVMELLG